MIKRSVGLLQFIVLVSCIFSFAYIISQEIGIVSADKAFVPEKGEKDSKPPVSQIPTLTTSSSTASKYLGIKYKTAEAAKAAGKSSWQVVGSGIDAVASGIQWAFIAYSAGTMVGDLFGLSQKNSQALGTSLAAGLGTYQILDTYAFGESSFFGPESFAGKYLGPHAGAIGIGVGALVFLSTYKDEKIKTVEFNCMPWQAPIGGENCEVCNDGSLPCSEYRCQSLGQSCEIVNEGTTDEKCVYVNPHDVDAPIIRPNYDELTTGHAYKNVKTSPPGPGFEVVNTASRDGCLKAFTPLQFGLTLNEPAQCKIDTNHTESFDEMRAYIGGSNLYSYNHSERLNLPGAKDLSASGFVLENGKDMTFFMRCQDKNGNTNEAEYALKFCVDPSPDTTAPSIEATSVANGGCVAEDATTSEVVFYVNEPSVCRWSFQDSDYELMTEEMVCSNSYNTINAVQLFPCRTTLTGISKEPVTYYVRCKDQQGKEEKDRNVNRESFEFVLKGSDVLIMKNLKPNESVSGGVSPAPIELYVETLYGCLEGRAVCSWSEDNVNYVEFFDTNNEDGISTQVLNLEDGMHEIFVRCIDAGGNVAEDVAEFEVNIETGAPVIARVYEEDGMLKVVTTRDSECSYSLDSCDFSFSEGTEMPYGNTSIHVTDWSEDNTYYIKCRDEFLNEAADCSLVVRPTENFL